MGSMVVVIVGPVLQAGFSALSSSSARRCAQKYRSQASSARHGCVEHPDRILGNHTEDELAKVPADALSSHRGSMPRELLPIQLESGPMPTNDRFWLNEINACFHPHQNRCNTAQNHRSGAANRSCGRLCLNATNCCRSARFSKSRSRRERKKRIGKVDSSLSSRNMRPVLHEHR